MLNGENYIFQSLWILDALFLDCDNVRAQTDGLIPGDKEVLEARILCVPFTNGKSKPCTTARSSWSTWRLGKFGKKMWNILWENATS